MQHTFQSLRTVRALRYVAPLREGGSMPGLIEADDDFLYVLKFKGAGQGTKALIAEMVGGEVARLLGFKVPELVFIELAEGFGRMEGDEEIQDLLQGSVGLNLGLHYLSSSLTFDPVATLIDARLASQIVWLDSFLLNVDRTARNTNMLWWQKELWLIDHGACLYFHHSWNNPSGQQAFAAIKNHVLLPLATDLEQVNAEYKQLLTTDFLRQLIEAIPEVWLANNYDFETIEEHRKAYLNFLTERLAHSSEFVNEANHARLSLI